MSGILCTLHGISDVVKAVCEYRFINPRHTQDLYISMPHDMVDCSIEVLCDCLNRVATLIF